MTNGMSFFKEGYRCSGPFLPKEYKHIIYYVFFVHTQFIFCSPTLIGSILVGHGRFMQAVRRGALVHSHTCYTRQPVMQWLSVCCVFVSLFDRFLWVSLFKFIWSLLAELECLIIDLFTCLFLFVGIQSFVRQVWLGRYSSGKAACVS